MSSPLNFCELCGNVDYVRPDGRGFPPDISKRRLIKNCKSHGCACQPKYQAGMSPEIHRLLRAVRDSA